jgi:lactate 2-monooxygenase
MRNYTAMLICLYFLYSIVDAQVQSAQELLDSVLNPDPKQASWSSYGTQIYYNATLFNTTPIASTNYDRLEQEAKLVLRPEAYDYAAGGAGLERTVASNRAAFDKVL